MSKHHSIGRVFYALNVFTGRTTREFTQECDTTHPLAEGTAESYRVTQAVETGIAELYRITRELETGTADLRRITRPVEVGNSQRK